MAGFKQFLLRGNVVELAVAVIIAVAFGAVIKAFTEGIITPFIGIFGGVPDFSAWTVTIGQSKFLIGSFINAVLTFVITAAIVYFFVIVPVTRATAKPEAPASTKECPECLSKVPLAARRCSSCAQPLTG